MHESERLRCTLHYHFLPRLFATFQHLLLDRIISHIHRDINKMASNLCDNVFWSAEARVPCATGLKLSTGERRQITKFFCII